LSGMTDFLDVVGAGMTGLSFEAAVGAQAS
jgi:hypothetical protein